MNKAELIERVSKQTHQTKMSIEETLNAAFDVIKKSVKRGDDVTLVGFGKEKHGPEEILETERKFRFPL